MLNQVLQSCAASVLPPSHSRVQCVPAVDPAQTCALHTKSALKSDKAVHNDLAIDHDQVVLPLIMPHRLRPSREPTVAVLLTSLAMTKCGIYQLELSGCAILVRDVTATVLPLLH